MGTYNAVTFGELAENSMFRPAWERENNVTIRNIPYGNKDNIQGAGLGNPRITVRILVSSDANMATLQTSVGSTARTLTNLFYTGNDYSNTYLVNLTDIQRHDVSTTWTATATFMREGS